MPYFIYKIFAEGDEKVLEHVEEHDMFVEARNRVRAMRAELPADADYMVRIIFAANQSDAEMQLKEKREAPILKEWEK